MTTNALPAKSPSLKFSGVYASQPIEAQKARLLKQLVHNNIPASFVELENGPTKKYKFATVSFPDRYDADFKNHIDQSCLYDKFSRESNFKSITVAGK